MRLIFLFIARDELAEVKRFYNRQQQGLGDAFKREVEAAAKLILERPLAWQVEIEPARRFLLNQFPCKMVYVVRAEQIVVLAIMHQHRQPDYWVDRVDPA